MKTKGLKIRRLLLATIALVMLLGTAAMASKTITLRYNSGNKLYYGTYKATKDDTLYFKMPVKYNGLLEVTGGYMTSYGGPYGISETMYNARGYRLDYWSSNYVNYDTNTTEQYAVTPGNYYFKVKAYKGNTYIFGASYVPKVLGSPKGGSSKARSYTLARNKAVSGIISSYSYKQAKWFKFYVPSTSKGVKIRVLAKGGQGWINAYIAGPNLSRTRKMTIHCQKGYNHWQDLNMYTQHYGYRYYKTGPKPGWYYVLVTKGTGSDKYSSTRFTVRWSYYNF